MWFGVPVLAWCPRFFSLACVKVGKFIKHNDDTEKRRRLDVARVLLSIPFLNNINMVFTVVIDRVQFKIKITEEIEGCTFNNNKRTVTGESDEESLWSDDLINLITLGLAEVTVNGGSDCVFKLSSEVQSSPK
ncbi:hypothetical protein ACS0TY_013763 [Phlomoides rotata]